MLNRLFKVGINYIDLIVDEFESLWKDSTPLIICDTNTWDVAGKRIYDHFYVLGTFPQAFVFPESHLEPTAYNVKRVKDFLEKYNGIAIAVGSGTINDLVKRASFEVNQSYAVFPTAPSVDGYTSYGAALIVDGFKTTLPCNPPYLVLADTEIIRNAPLDMIASGYGDLSAKITAGADWITASQLGIEPIDKQVWKMVQGPLKTRLSNPELLKQRDGKIITNFFKGLIEVGYAMEIYKDSRPASGAEHLLSHVWEMEHLCVNDIPVSHGFKVSIGTLVVTAMMMELRAYTSDNLIYFENVADTWSERLKEIKLYFDESLSSFDKIVQASSDKFCGGEKLEERRELYKNNIDKINDKIADQIIPFKELQNRYKLAGCPFEPKMIGLTREQLASGIRKAQYIRKRYTILDLLYETGLIDSTINAVVYSNKYFTEFKE
jgi:glycerol-1-phosphate dehydrogenase [NAD(P)+]